MSNNLNVEKMVWLVGAGAIAVEYAKVLDALAVPFVVIGRGRESAALFQEKTGHPVETGGIQGYLAKVRGKPWAAIIAVSVDQLAGATSLLLQNGVENILVEKPAGLDLAEIAATSREAARYPAARVFVAYNRRFYASTLSAREIIDRDGGVLSFNFEFTEWSEVIACLEMAPRIKENWFLANSTHVVDLAFFLGGWPEEICCYTAGGLPWHPAAAMFSGAGRTSNGTLFSYQANWDAPGRWGVELLTRQHRLIFRPLEELHVQARGSVAVQKLELDNSLDLHFKPGFYRQVEAFLVSEREDLCSLQDHNRTGEQIFARMRGGQNYKE